MTVERTELLAWQTALELADGDVSRLQRLSEKEVLVRNTGATKRGA